LCGSDLLYIVFVLFVFVLFASVPEAFVFVLFASVPETFVFVLFVLQLFAFATYLHDNCHLFFADTHYHTYFVPYKAIVLLADGALVGAAALMDAVYFLIHPYFNNLPYMN
jgi:hypothetical protein